LKIRIWKLEVETSKKSIAVEKLLKSNKSRDPFSFLKEGVFNIIVK
jgi:hypothetical protein